MSDETRQWLKDNSVQLNCQQVLTEERLMHLSDTDRKDMVSCLLRQMARDLALKLLEDKLIDVSTIDSPTILAKIIRMKVVVIKP